MKNQYPTYAAVNKRHTEAFGVGVRDCRQAIVRRERGMAGPAAHNRQNPDAVKTSINEQQRNRINIILDELMGIKN